MHADLPSVIALLVVLTLGLSVLVYQGVTGVPPVSSSAAEAAEVVALLRQAGLPERAVIYDLGCGWGALVLALARAFPDAQIRGIELSPLPYWVARFRARNVPNLRIRRADFHRCDLRDADAITCHLLIGAMPRVASLLDRALRPGTPVVSLTFWFRGREVYAAQRSAGPLRQAALYYWPAPKVAEPIVL
jgi:SAM-dependent methyltransferase